MGKTLFLVSTKGLGDFYIVATTPNDAETTLTSALNKTDYGFSKDRKITNIKILADQLMDFPSGKPFFSSGNNLIIA